MPASEQEEARVLHHVREALARAPEVIALDLGTCLKQPLVCRVERNKRNGILVPRQRGTL